MTTSTLYLAISLSTLTAGDISPIISYSSDGVNGGETLLLCGDAFDQPGLKVARWLPPQPAQEEWQDAVIQRASLERALAGNVGPPPAPKGRLDNLTLSHIERHTCAARLPQGGYLQVQAFYLHTDHGAATPRIINRPQIWWATPEFPEPGNQMRLFGRSLYSRFSGTQAAWLRDSNGSLQQIEFSLPRGVLPGYDSTLTRPYELRVLLPNDLTPGDYDLIVHNGSGGDLGWSVPFEISVQRRPAQPNVMVAASSHGAIPNDSKSDSEALEQALQKVAAEPNGGVVQLESGVYHLSRNLKLPPNTILRGIGREATAIATLNDAPIATPFPHENFPDRDAGYYKAVTGVTPMIWLPARCGLEHLTVRGAPETLDVLIGTRDGPGEGIALRSCTIINRHPAWYPGGNYRFPGNCVLVAGATDGLVIRDCHIEGSAPITSMMQLLRRATIAGNTLTSFPPGRSDCAAFRKPIECIIEDNCLQNAKRGLVVQPQGMAVHNLVANNRVEHIERGGNAGEVELWEGGTVLVGGRIKASDSKSLTGDGIAWEVVDRQGTRKDLHGDALAGHVCLITNGRGLGQYRFVSSLDGDILTVDRPWDVPPAPGAEFVVTTSSIENLILNNSDRDGDAGMQIWGGCIANVICGHISDDTEGIILHAADRRKDPGSLARIQKCWFNDIRHCRFEHGARMQVRPSRRPVADLDDAGALVFGNTVRHCLWGDSPRLPNQNQWYAFWERKNVDQNVEFPTHHCAIHLGVRGGYVGDPDDPAWDSLSPAVTSNIIERNFIDSGWPIGIYESRSARGNIIPDTNKLLSEHGVLRVADSGEE